MFLFFSFTGTQVALTAGQPEGTVTSAPDASVFLYIALSFGFSLMANVWLFFRVSGGLFNPSVSHGFSAFIGSMG
jgi:aquaporin related protein